MSVANIANNLDISTIINTLTKSKDFKIKSLENNRASFELQISNLGKNRVAIEGLQSTIGKIDAATQTIAKADLSKELKAFADGFNSIRDSLRTSNDFNQRTLTSKIRENVDFQELQKLGLSFDKTGRLNFDEIKFNQEFDNNNAQTITTTQNLFDNLNSKPFIFTNITDRFNGSIQLQENRITQQNRRIDDQVDNIERQKRLITDSYIKQYASLQNYLNTLNSTERTISQILNSLNQK